MAHTVDVSPEPIQVVLNRVKSAVGAVGKEGRNQQQNFNFRGVDQVVNAVSPHLNEHGIITVPEVLSHSYETIEIGSKRTAMGHVTLKVKYHFYGPAGDALTATVVSESMDSGDKAMAKAMSVAYRIALLQVLNLPTTEADPDSQSYERSEHVTESVSQSQAKRVEATAEKPKSGESLNPGQIFEMAKSAKSVDEARSAYQAAASNGHLTEKVPGQANLTLKDYILQRADDLKFRDGAPSAEKVGANN